ncbi:exonuclease : Exonuclease OS=Acaryochloris marina (strain MBIC 11017) GN=AM1_2401 PE=4 SV=1: RNase_T [Gemmata massiliana]|uniref:Exonuclease domain-containing protein n=1 Tax=Gemmata massiliana TaxID=1210884 RepID=A0A6P2DE18_9BACT|nr:3'-5' exonuclease [Gemmata massiliana]VTR97652.1 exonuclease : Exonuclease OS=Acaryochloris marina (strain MBIC 11017) GN=AM1_2401 PE=4 SV=1: RNase_T [Gemmata massiliana]
MTPRRKKPPVPLPPLDGPFVAIDFETADNGPDSACAVGIVRVENSKIVHREAVLIRPPRERILFTYVHGITWPMVKSAPVFKDVWSKVAPVLEGAAFLAAHNAPFDRRVLSACCAAAELTAPALPFVCTVQLARRKWALKPANLPAVCRRLGIGLMHHDAGSDAEACARIVIAAAFPGNATDAAG